MLKPHLPSRCIALPLTLSDADRGGSRGNNFVGQAEDASSRQTCATNEAADSTLPTPLREQYHKCAPVIRRRQDFETCPRRGAKFIPLDWTAVLLTSSPCRRNAE